MKAIVQTAYGAPEGALELREVAAPQPDENEVLVRVHGSSVNVADWIFQIGRPWMVRLASGLFTPKRRIPGKDLSGRVEAAGSAVTRFRTGDEVYGMVDAGAYAERVCVCEDVLDHKPKNLDFAEAAAVPLAGLTALQGLRDSGRIETGQRVLVNGASGGVGTFAVQIAKALGAHVTGVCSARNAELVAKLGADATIDYAREDFTRSGQRYDLIFDLVGSHPLSGYRRALAPAGRYVACVAKLGLLFRTALTSIFSKRFIVMPTMKPLPADLRTLRKLIEAGRLEPVVERRYSLAEVPLALEAQGAGHARGKKVIAI